MHTSIRNIRRMKRLMNLGEREEHSCTEIPNFHRDDAFEPEEEFSDGRLRISLVWGGDPPHRNARNRFCPLAFWQSFLNLTEIRYYSFQLSPQKEGISRLSLNSKITD